MEIVTEITPQRDGCPETAVKLESHQINGDVPPGEARLRHLFKPQHSTAHVFDLAQPVDVHQEGVVRLDGYVSHTRAAS